MFVVKSGIIICKYRKSNVTSGTWYALDIDIYDGNISCSIDDTEIFNVTDTTFSMGKAGLYCWANQSSYWDNFCIKRIFYLETPQNVTISVIADSVHISWDTVPGATSYKVYSDSDPYGTFEIVEWEGTATSWSESANTKKFYYMTALN